MKKSELIQKLRDDNSFYNELLETAKTAYKEAAKYPGLQYIVEVNLSPEEIGITYTYQIAGSNNYTENWEQIITFCFKGMEGTFDPSDDEVVNVMILDQNIWEEYYEQQENSASHESLEIFLKKKYGDFVESFHRTFNELKELNIEYVSDEVVEWELDNKLDELFRYYESLEQYNI